MPKTFDDWSHKISYEQASEILKSMGTSWSDPHPYQQLMKYYTQHLTDKSFVAATKTTTKAVASTTSTVGAQFDAAAWREALRRQNLGVTIGLLSLRPLRKMQLFVILVLLMNE